MAGYGTDGAFATWATANGYALPDGAPSVAVLRQRGSAYLDALYGAKVNAPRFSGQPTGGFAQERAWPRTGAEAYGAAIPSDIVPVAIEQASYFAAWHEANNPGSLSASATQAGALKRKKIDTIEKEYFEGSGDAAADATVRLSLVDGILAPYLRQVNGPCLGLWAVG